MICYADFIAESDLNIISGRDFREPFPEIITGVVYLEKVFCFLRLQHGYTPSNYTYV